MEKNKRKVIHKAAAIVTIMCIILVGSILPVHAAGTEFQIGIFYMPTWPYTNATQYDYIRDANINLIQSFYAPEIDIGTVDRMNTVLSLCNSRGIKVQVSDARSQYLLTTATDAEIDAIAASYKNNPATGGYYVKDEPTTDADVQRAAYVYKRFLRSDPDSNPNVNNWMLLGPTFLESLEKFINYVDPANLKYLTYDHYPWNYNNRYADTYYRDMMNCRSKGLSYNIKYGAYLQSVGASNGVGMMRPNEDQMRLDAWSNLAYGMKYLTWFTWFQPVYTGSNWTTAIMDQYGNKTDLYTPVQTINGEIAVLGPTLMSLTSRDVYFKGTQFKGTTPVPSDYFFSPATAYDQIISHFANADGRSYVMVVNRDHENSRTLSFNLPSKPSAVTQVSKTTGLEVSTNYSSSTGNLSDTFLPGEGKLFAISSDFALPAQMIDDKDVGILYSGSSWKYSAERSVGNYEDDLHYGTANGDYFEYTFVGTGIDYISEKGGDYGDVDIYIDGVFQQTVNLYSPSRLVQQTVYSKTGLTNGVHRIKGVKKNATYIILEGFKIYSDTVTRNAVKTNDTDKSITYTGTWNYSGGRGVGDYYNDVHWTKENNDYFQYTFKGTGVDYITEVCNDQGDVDIYIDGVFQQTVSCYNAARITQQTVYSKTGLAYGTHTIKGVKKSGTYMLLDGFNEISGDNLLANSGFENGTTSWGVGDGTGSSIAADAANAHTGAKGCKSYNRTHMWSSPSQDVTSSLKANGIGNYNLSGWIKLASGTDKAQVCIAITDSKGKHYVSTDFKSVNSTDWTQCQKNCNITWRGELISASLYVQTESTTNTMYLDDFILSR